MKKIVYYYLLMSQKDLVENQVVEEIFREKANFYFDQNRQTDFWILMAPKFIKEKKLLDKIRKSRFYKQQKSNISCFSLDTEKEFFVALVSTNKDFIRWVGLRIGYFEDLDLSFEDSNRNDSKSYISNGVSGYIVYSRTERPEHLYPSVDTNQDLESKDQKMFPLLSNPKYLYSDLLVNKYKKLLQSFYEKSENDI
jgi:hypothetical protein